MFSEKSLYAFFISTDLHRGLVVKEHVLGEVTLCTVGPDNKIVRIDVKEHVLGEVTLCMALFTPVAAIAVRSKSMFSEKSLYALFFGEPPH